MLDLLLLFLLCLSSCAGQPPDDTDGPSSTPIPDAADAAVAHPAPLPPPVAEPEPPAPPAGPSPVELRAREILAAISAADDPRDRPYRWLAGPAAELLAQRFAPPPGHERIPAEPGSFADWLRYLPLKPPGSPVLLHTGELKGLQSVHEAVIDMDVGRRDLQQCADAVMRLRAEYLYAADRERDICFRSVQRKKLKWRGSGLGSFRKYLDKVFGIANSASLMREMVPVRAGEAVEIGDVLIEPARGGAFGHAVMLMDAAASGAGERVFLVSQSYMPAQESHVLKNPAEPDIAPWYRIDPSRSIRTPEWTFPADSLRRFAETGCP